MCCGASSSRTSRTTRSTCANSDLKRYGMITGLRAEKLEEYKRLHATVWPDVLRRIKQSHIQNYSIYLRQLEDGQPYLFSYFEYTGSDFAADMAAMAADEGSQHLW